MLFEVCLQSVDDAVAAEAGGAQRVELCAALVEGGITPSLGSIRACRDTVDIDIMVMIRPRGGDFVYTDWELDAMAKDIAECRKIGVTGVVFGMLELDGTVARTQVQRMVEEAGPDLSVTFHRAFDVSADPFASLETLIDLNVNRILTSGQAATVPEGKELIRQLVARAGDRIGILPGCGITPENVAEMVTYTGVTEFHATAFATLESPMQHQNPAVYMGIPGLPEYERQITTAAEVRRFLTTLGIRN
ncbi:copper homeostasis protein CutC [Neolewinella aurantiaca]|uniref:PF03932 family protein CutC n=1 Tax=Neolewinella aurantiaca TaxID=2602767 RepID=A0A5C7FNA2_9BACT|nr:copper homeostasis protein CutC [Neolewinella aurantiaca]TXF87833.1 copper homeostasis protein CutC [Neolewinella aurantiaca]